MGILAGFTAVNPKSGWIKATGTKLFFTARYLIEFKK